MKKNMMRRTTIREIRQSFGRYFAILAIVALGIGFFAGLKMAKPDMIATGNDYFAKLNLFDYRLLSTLGFRQSDVDKIQKQEDVESAAGSVSADILYIDESGNENVMRVHSITENINGLWLKSGRMPNEANECVVDASDYDESAIGQKIVLSQSNEDEDIDLFAYREYEIVGVAQSSYYANFERGNTSIGTGKINSFMYIPKDGFDVEYYTEIFVKFNKDYQIYSDEYKAYMDEKDTQWEKLCKEIALERYEDIKKDAQSELADAEKEFFEKKEEGEKELANAVKELEDAQAEIDDGEDRISEARKQLEDKEKEISDAERGIKNAESELVNQEAGIVMMEQNPLLAAQAEGARLQLEEAKQALAQSKIKVDSGKKQIAEVKRTLDEEETTLLEAKEEIANGWDEYRESKAEFDEEIAKAETDIADAKEEIEKIEKPDTYVLGRETNVGYACFESDTDIVEGIANVFPLFFFLVAALVCMTTMNRMVEEQRTQIGVLKALGYNEAAIMGKYVFYSGSAAVIGGVGGFFGGTWLFPKVIWTAYGVMYSMQKLQLVFDAKLAISSFAAALICSVGVTLYTCHNELNLVAAELMRPKSPKAGKRVFMEYIPFIWKRLKFLQKVSVRNIVRYKKRFFMMVVGISGCTALLLVGFGIKDSVADIGMHQYDEIQIYDMNVSFSKVQDNENSFFENKAEEMGFSYMYICEKSVDLVTDEAVKAINMVIAADEEQFDNFVDLHTENGGKLLYPRKTEAVITNRIAHDYNLSVGDTVILRDDELNEIEVKVSGIAQNFVYNYIYINDETYESQKDTDVEYKSAYLNISDTADTHKTAAALMKGSDIVGITINSDVSERFSNMMMSLDYVVILVIACAAFLAFIVLYNLTNINITERIREIATIKVLGFYRMETASYVFRENMVLTGIGSIVGLLLGILLHRFVMSRIKVDMVSFANIIKGQSFLYSMLLTFLFTIIVNIVMSAKIEKINMAESLKSVD